MFEFGGIVGMTIAGIICAKIFKNSKPLTAAFLCGMCTLFIIVYFFVPAGAAWAWLDYLCLVMIGLSIYGPVMFVGLYSMDIVPKRAAGAASGMAGLFSYLIGSMIASLGLGVVADNFGWGAVFAIYIVSGILCVMFALFARDKAVEESYTASMKK